MLRLVVILLIIALLANAIRQAATDPTDAARIGFDSRLWGPHFWLALHICAINTARDFGSSSRNFDKYLYSMQTVLPCRECRDELKLLLNTVPPRTFVKHGRIGCVAYVYVMHCCVSDRLKGVVCAVPFLQEEQRYLKEYVKPDSVDIAATMAELHQDAEERGIYRLIEDARTKLRRMLADRAKALGLPAHKF